MPDTALRASGRARVAYVAMSPLSGAAAGFLALHAVYGVALAALVGLWLSRQAGGEKWFVAGGYLLGMGVCAAAVLSPALTNHDPAVRYDSSTIPFFWVAVVVALVGAVTLAVAAVGRRRHGASSTGALPAS